MLVTKLFAFASLAAQGVFAAPAAEPAPAPAPAPIMEGTLTINGTEIDVRDLKKRGEGIHIVNCWPWGGAGVTQTWLSLVFVSLARSHHPPGP